MDVRIFDRSANEIQVVLNVGVGPNCVVVKCDAMGWKMGAFLRPLIFSIWLLDVFICRHGHRLWFEFVIVLAVAVLKTASLGGFPF